MVTETITTLERNPKNTCHCEFNVMMLDKDVRFMKRFLQHYSNKGNKDSQIETKSIVP